MITKSEIEMMAEAAAKAMTALMADSREKEFLFRGCKRGFIAGFEMSQKYERAEQTP